MPILRMTYQRPTANGATTGECAGTRALAGRAHITQGTRGRRSYARCYTVSAPPAQIFAAVSGICHNPASAEPTRNFHITRDIADGVFVTAGSPGNPLSAEPTRNSHITSHISADPRKRPGGRTQATFGGYAKSSGICQNGYNSLFFSDIRCLAIDAPVSGRYTL